MAGLARLGRDYAATYWREMVEQTGARRVVPIHYDDFTRPYGEVLALPRVVDDLEKSIGWLTELAARGERPVSIELSPWGVPIRSFPVPSESPMDSPA
jgi:L-ascorbate metabolism protein UlaG (beta-lactamase superfamily)